MHRGTQWKRGTIDKRVVDRVSVRNLVVTAAKDGKWTIRIKLSISTTNCTYSS